MLRKAMRWYSKQRLGTKHFIFLFIVTSVLFITIAWNHLQGSKRLFEKQVIQNSQEVISQTNEHLNTHLDNLKQMLLFLSTQHALFDRGNESLATSFLNEYGDINSNYVKTVYLLDKNGKVFSNRQVHYEIVGNVYIGSLLNKLPSSMNGVIWSDPYYTPLSGQTVAFVSAVRGSSNELKGYAVLEINLDQLTNKISPLFKSNNQTFLVTTSTKKLVTSEPFSHLLPIDQTVFPAQIVSSFMRKVTQSAIGVNKIKHDEKELVAVKSNVNKFGWHVISIIDEKYFYQNIFALYRNFVKASVLWIFTLMITSLMISRHFTAPIRQLVHVMDQVNDLNSMPKVHVVREDELGQLARSYNAMMVRIRELFNTVNELEVKKKDSELKMLQSQISPHFLYNTLACINSLAKQQRTHEVRTTIHALISLLSYSFNKTSEKVQLHDELEGLKKYLQIQQVRYGHQFELKIAIDDDILEHKVLKLLLQPLVENAIFHGIVPKGEGTIWIYNDKKDDQLRLYIRDNGVGFNKNLQKGLLTKVLNDSSKHGFNSIGLTNVEERIKIHYGEKYGLRMRSKEKVGTIIRIDLPLKQE
ncbi:HAMP domain-containing protein [Bacillaceae bacterium SIJ1]|uniref:cache domain-containing sensor histidine kinase n=1 Tax=Litoribacterium kuwaitense TaxID=1398745 RepID=UPI0013EAD2ED|nr:sensor histidine kinase [Litoribacterium kuwaitense]NGP44602.1 HAMP domain-containing protein [Litoribacterium kuwaitense]